MTKYNLNQFDTNGLGIPEIRQIILDFFYELQESGKFKQIHPTTIIQATESALKQYKKDNNDIGIELYQCQYCKKLYEDRSSCPNCCTINSKIVVKGDITEVWIWNHQYETWDYDLTL